MPQNIYLFYLITAETNKVQKSSTPDSEKTIISAAKIILTNMTSHSQIKKKRLPGFSLHISTLWQNNS